MESIRELNPFYLNAWGDRRIDAWTDTLTKSIKTIFSASAAPAGDNSERATYAETQQQYDFVKMDADSDGRECEFSKPGRVKYARPPEDPPSENPPNKSSISPTTAALLAAAALAAATSGASASTRRPRTPTDGSPPNTPFDPRAQFHTQFAPDGPVNSRLREDFLDSQGRGAEASVEHTLRDTAAYNERQERERSDREHRERQEADKQARDEANRRDQAARDRQDQANRDREEANRRQEEDRRRQDEDRRRQEEERRRNNSSGW